MTELSDEARRLLRTAREAYSPSTERVAAVGSAISTRIAARPGDEARDGQRPCTRLRRFWLGRALLIGVLGAELPPGHAREPSDTPRAEPSVAPSSASLGLTPAPVERAAQALNHVRAQPTAAESPTDTSPVPGLATRTAPVRSPSSPLPRSAASPKPRRAATIANVGARTQAASSVAAPMPPAPAAPEPPRVEDRAALDSASPALTTGVPTRSDRNAGPADLALRGESELILRANERLRQLDGAAALALADQHAAQFPRGRLRQERFAVRALALCVLRRFQDASSAADALASMAPRSPHLPRIRAACARAQPGSMPRSKEAR